MRWGALRGLGRRLVRGALLCSLACTPARREIEGDLVRRIRFEGNGGLLSGQNDYQLRQAIGQETSPLLTLTWPFTYFVTPVGLNLETIKADGRRLQVWYAHRGYFDARFTGWEIRRVRARDDKRAGVVDLLGHLEPGPLSLFRNVTVGGDMGLGAKTVVNAARRRTPLNEGDPFTLAGVDGATAAIRTGLGDNGFAYAAVQADIVADPPAQAVDVAIDVDPGPIATFGAIEIRGLERVEDVDVLGVLDFEPGDTFSLTALRESQRRLFETGLFSVVNIAVSPCAQARAAWARRTTKEISPPPCPVLDQEGGEADERGIPRVAPVRIELNEGRFRRVRLGGGVKFDYFTLQPRLGLSYRDLWVAGSKLQMRIDGGAGAIVGVVQDDEGASSLLFTGDAGLRFDYPWLLKSRLGITAGVKFEQGAQFGTLPFQRVSGDFGVRYLFTRSVSLKVGPTATYFRYLEPSTETLTAARLQFGGDFRSATYRLLNIEAQLLADWRDDPLFTRRGSYWRLGGAQSIPIPAPDGLGGTEPGFFYTKIDAEVRAWRPIRFSKKAGTFPLVLAGRLHGTILVPWRKDSALPYPDLAFLGGPNSLRGFRANQVGPYDLVCSYRPSRPNPQHANGRKVQLTRTYLPRGGALALEAAGEARLDVDSGVSVALFADVGLLERDLADIGGEDIRYGGGIGVRYDTAVGPIRLDIGFRPLFAEDQGPSSAINCNPIDRLPRGFDLWSGGRRARQNLDQRTMPIGINLFLAIGQAF